MLQYMPIAIFSMVGSRGALLAIPLLLLISASFVAAIVVMGAFCTGGVAALRSLRRIWWWLCAAGAILSLIGGTLLLSDTHAYAFDNNVSFALRVGVYGTPLLIPYVHVLLELFLRRGVPHAA
jgi:hypothetical protein